MPYLRWLSRRKAIKSTTIEIDHGSYRPGADTAMTDQAVHHMLKQTAKGVVSSFLNVTPGAPLSLKRSRREQQWPTSKRKRDTNSKAASACSFVMTTNKPEG
jgi:hypothetical protein